MIDGKLGMEKGWIRNICFEILLFYFEFYNFEIVKLHVDFSNIINWIDNEKILYIYSKYLKYLWSRF